MYNQCERVGNAKYKYVYIHVMKKPRVVPKNMKNFEIEME